MHINHIGSTPPHFSQTYSPFPTHPTLFLLLQKKNYELQFVLSIQSQKCGFHWRAVYKPGICPQRKLTLPFPEAMNRQQLISYWCNFVSTSPLHGRICLAWACTDLQDCISIIVNVYVQLSCCIQKTVSLQSFTTYGFHNISACSSDMIS